MSTAGTQLNFGAQELFIQQLQDEIKRLSGVNQQLQIRARQMHHQLMRQREDQVQSLASHATKSTTSNRPTSVIVTRDLAVDDVSSGSEANSDLLRVKLKTAAKYIHHLMREKEHLIEMSNRLRGELNRMKCKLNILKNEFKFGLKIMIFFLD